MSAATLICRFEPLDTWFFRESRPHGSVGSSELESAPLPSARTLAGALRTCLGDAWHAHHGSNWQQFAKGETPPLRKLIGLGRDLGALRVRGPFLCLDGERLWPAPAHLMRKEKQAFLLRLGDAVRCDLGRVRLPCFPAPGSVPQLPELAGSQSASGQWLSEAGWRKVLAGQAPDADAKEIFDIKDLLDFEPRLGIGRDNQRRAVSEGLLYQTRHVRFTQGVAVELELSGPPDMLQWLPPAGQTRVVRLGGEGRQAALRIEAATSPQPSPTGARPDASLFALILTTPLPLAEGKPLAMPPGFARATHEGLTVWAGEWGDKPLRILSVACARPMREGGWNMARHRAEAVRSLLPAGSVLYAQAPDGLPPSLPALPVARPEDVAWGYGQVAAAVALQG